MKNKISLSLNELQEILNGDNKDVDICSAFNAYLNSNVNLDIEYIVDNLHKIDFENSDKQDIYDLFVKLVKESKSVSFMVDKVFDSAFDLYDKELISKKLLIDCLEIRLKNNKDFLEACQLSIFTDEDIPYIVKPFIDKDIFKADDFLEYMRHVGFIDSVNSMNMYYPSSDSNFYRQTTISLSQFINEQNNERFLLDENVTNDEVKEFISNLNPDTLESIRSINLFLNAIDSENSKHMDRYNFCFETIVETNPELISSMSTKLLTLEQMDKIISLGNPRFFDNMVESDAFKSLEMTEKIQYAKIMLESVFDDSKWISNEKEEGYMVDVRKANLAYSLEKALDLDLPYESSGDRHLRAINDAIEQMDNGFQK